MGGQKPRFQVTELEIGLCGVRYAELGVSSGAVVMGLLAELERAETAGHCHGCMV